MKRTAYMRWLLTQTQDVKQIALLIAKDCLNRKIQSYEVIELTGDKKFTYKTFLKAAKIVIESK